MNKTIEQATRDVVEAAWDAYERTKDEPEVLYTTDRVPVMALSWKFFINRSIELLNALRAAKSSPPPAETLDLDAIEARANAATPGPWEHRSGWWRVEGPWNPDRLRYYDIALDVRNQGDGDFIAAARTDVPTLAAAVRARDAEIHTLRTALADAQAKLANHESIIIQRDHDRTDAISICDEYLSCQSGSPAMKFAAIKNILTGAAAASLVSARKDGAR